MEKLFTVLAILLLIAFCSIVVVVGISAKKEAKKCRVFCYPQKFQIEADHCLCLEPTRVTPMADIDEQIKKGAGK